MKNLIKKILTEIEVPHMHQPTGNSCGPTCLKMVHDYFVGSRFKISDICRACSTDWVVGTPPERMVKGLNYMGIEYIEHINDENPFDALREAIDKGHPCIIRTVTQGTPHWIIAVDYDNEVFDINDPWLGRIIYDEEELDSIWHMRDYFFYEVTNADKDVYPDYDNEPEEDYMDDENDNPEKGDFLLMTNDSNIFDNRYKKGEMYPIRVVTKMEGRTMLGIPYSSKYKLKDADKLKQYSYFGVEPSKRGESYKTWFRLVKKNDVHKKWWSNKKDRKIDVPSVDTEDMFNTLYESTNSEPEEDYMDDEYYGSFDGSDWYNQKDELTDTTKGEWEVEEFGSFEDFKNSPYGQDISNKWSTHPNYDSGEKYFNMYKDKFGPIKIKKKVDIDYDKTTDVFNSLYESTGVEPEMWSNEWLDNVLVNIRQAVGNETLSLDDLADFDEDTGNQDWQSAEELLRAFVDWYSDQSYEGYDDEPSNDGEQLELDFPEDSPSNSDEVEISHFESEEEILAALRVGLKVFEGQMPPKDLLTYLSKAADWEISVKATYNGKVVGFYLLSEGQISDYMLHYMQRDYNCYSVEQCNKKHPGTIKVNPSKFKDLSGVEGVALGVDPNHKGLGIGKKLIGYSQKLPYDYVWGQQYEHLGNIEHWIKRREVAAYFPGLYLTYQML